MISAGFPKVLLLYVVVLLQLKLVLRSTFGLQISFLVGWRPSLTRWHLPSEEYFEYAWMIYVKIVQHVMLKGGTTPSCQSWLEFSISASQVLSLPGIFIGTVVEVGVKRAKAACGTWTGKCSLNTLVTSLMSEMSRYDCGPLDPWACFLAAESRKAFKHFDIQFVNRSYVP